MVWRRETSRAHLVEPALDPSSAVSNMTVARGQVAFAFSCHLMYTLRASILTTSAGRQAGNRRHSARAPTHGGWNYGRSWS